ncbi:DUF5615 family PIN-like protein [Pseudactinotalea suaedae]|uniref:DUF5615 family PIN-like protein n=1 Tax=Pseudactinotalea suaedae TaxID=1524924 RepID=UPI0019D5D1BD|nr:DUF5615 family PIN-like protein [Pseudactinotalea suaedae]
MDAQPPPALAQYLRDHGHEAEHVHDIGPHNVSDRELWRLALDRDAVIVTKDEDFSLMLGMRGEAPAIVWVRIGNTRSAALLSWFGPLLEHIVELVDSGQKLIELR